MRLEVRQIAKELVPTEIYIAFCRGMFPISRHGGLIISVPSGRHVNPKQSDTMTTMRDEAAAGRAGCP